MRLNTKSYILPLAMIGFALPAAATVITYPGMTASFATQGVAQSTAVIPLDATYGQFGGVTGLVRYYSGTIALTNAASPSWSSAGKSTVNFFWNARAADSDLVAATIGVAPNNGGNIRFSFMDYGYDSGSILPATLDYQIKLTGTGGSGAQYTMSIFIGAAATAATEGTPSSTGGGNFTYYGDYITAVSFSTSGAGNTGTAASSNFKSSDAWISGAAVPEPSAALLGGLGALVLLRRRRA